MLVTAQTKLSEEFLEWLQQQMEASGLTINRLALLAQVDQPQLNKIVRGKLNATDSMLRKIAPHLGMTPERLVILAAMDRIGGADALRKHAPEAVADPITQMLAELPDDMSYPPDGRELKWLAKIPAELWVGTELDPRSGSPLWMEPPGPARLNEIKMTADALGASDEQEDRHA